MGFLSDEKVQEIRARREETRRPEPPAPQKENKICFAKYRDLWRAARPAGPGRARSAFSDAEIRESGPQFLSPCDVVEQFASIHGSPFYFEVHEYYS
jgi:hypothetical protein